LVAHYSEADIQVFGCLLNGFKQQLGVKAASGGEERAE